VVLHTGSCHRVGHQEVADGVQLDVSMWCSAASTQQAGVAVSVYRRMLLVLCTPWHSLLLSLSFCCVHPVVHRWKPTLTILVNEEMESWGQGALCTAYLSPGRRPHQGLVSAQPPPSQ
jgi:hypothetical protein